MSRNKLLAAIAISITLLCMPGCLGRMALSGKVGKFNLEVTESKWGREGVFLGLYFIPVYPFAAFADLMIFNSIEFWTGENPLSGESALVDIATGDE